eukprot:19335-Heterococcus_DN1.PRE.6
MAWHPHFNASQQHHSKMQSRSHSNPPLSARQLPPPPPFLVMEELFRIGLNMQQMNFQQQQQQQSLDRAAFSRGGVGLGFSHLPGSPRCNKSGYVVNSSPTTSLMSSESACDSLSPADSDSDDTVRDYSGAAAQPRGRTQGDAHPGR